MAAAGQAMVKEAMANLKMRKGATLSQIREQLEANYSGKVDFKKKGLLTTALRGLLDKGQVERLGSNYRLVSHHRRHRRRKHHGRRRRHHRRRRHVRRRSHPRRRHRRRRHHAKHRRHRRRRH